MVGLTRVQFYGKAVAVANDYNASINLNTAEAEKGVKNLDTAVGELDKKLAALDKTIKSSQGNLDTVTKSMSELTRANAALIRSESDRAKATVQAARADRETIINQGRVQKSVNETAIAQAKAARIAGQTSNAGRSSMGTEARRDAESAAKITAQTAVSAQRLATESVRTSVANENLAASSVRAGMAQERAAAQTARFGAAQDKARNSSLELNDSLSNSRYLLYDVGQTYAVLSAALLAIPTATAAVAIAYEKDFAQVMRTNMELENTGGSFAGLRQELKQLATEIPLTFKEFSSISTIGGQLGIAGKDIGAFTETVARFGAASNVSLEEASTAFGRFQQSFEVAKGKNTPDYFNKLGSAIAYVGVKSAASETEIVAVANQISAAGSQFGFTTDQVVGLSGALASVRIRPELARGAFQRIMLGLSSAADEGAASFDKFAKYTNVTGDAAIKLFKTNPSEFFHQYIGGIKDSIAATGSVSTVLDDIGAKNVFDKQFILGLANGYDVFTSSLQNSSKAFSEGTFLNSSTEGVFNTMEAKLQRIASSIKNLSDTVAKGSLQGLSGIADNLMGIVGALDRFTQATPGFAAFINLALGLGTAAGVLLAFKSAQAFVLAGLVGFQQVLGKTSIAAGLTLKGNLQELAKTLLMTKGVTAEASAEFVRSSGVMRAMGASATLTKAQIQGLNTGVGVAGTTAATAGTKMGIAGVATRGFGAALSFVGGPIGIAVGALAILATSFITAGEEANSAGDAIARAMNNGATAGIAGAAEALDKIKVKLTDTIALGNLDRTLTEVARDAGVPFEKLAEAATKGKDAGKAVLAVMNEVAQNKGFKDFAELQSKSFGSQNHAGQLEFLRKKVEEVGNASTTAAKNQDDLAKAGVKSGEAAAGAAPAVDEYGNAIGGVGDEAGDAEKKLDDFINKIFGLADAQSATQDALNNLGEGLANSTDFGAGTEGGRENIANFRDALRAGIEEQQYLIDSTQKSTAQASADYVAYVDGLVKEMAARGVDPAQVMAAANQAKGYFQAGLSSGAQPKVAVQVDAVQVADEAMTASTRLQAFINQNNPKFAIGADTSEAYNRMFVLAQSLAEITGYPYEVILDALTNPASEKSKEIYDLIKSITDQTYTAPIDADTSAAVANVKNFADYAAQQLNAVQSAYNEVAASAPTLAKYTQSLFPGAKSAGTAPAGIAAPSQSSVAQVAAPTQVKAKPSANGAPNFDGLANGYQKVQDAAEKAGEKGKKAGEDMANGIDDATQAANDYANRLKQGLQSAFDKQYGMATAADAYHSALNAINKKREDELKQIDDLIAKQKELNNSRKEDLITARKAGIEKSISQKYGETDRAADYANQEQTALDSAAAKQKDIAATKAQQDTIQAGIGTLTGFSQAAIDNRAALRDLESKMLDMVSAYAATGRSQEQVRAYAIKLQGQFRNDVVQLGYNRTAVANLQGNLSRYIGVVNAVPRTKPTTVTADTKQAMGAINGVKNALAGIQPKTVDVKVNYRGTVFKMEGKTTSAGQQIYGVTNPDTGKYNGTMLFNKGGQVPAFAGGGQIPGKAPANPGVDNLMAQVDGKGLVKVRSQEFIVQQPAVDYWGLPFMNAINNMKMPQFNSGGSVGGFSGGSGSGGAMLVELTAEAIAAIQRMPQIILTTENRVIAQSANDGNAVLATQGAN